jgi:hypothetical protein
MSHRLGVWAALWECSGCCPACAGLPFIAEGCVTVVPGAKGSFPSSTDDATKPKNIIALSNPHTRTTGFQGTTMYMEDLRGRRPRSFSNIRSDPVLSRRKRGSQERFVSKDVRSRSRCHQQLIGRHNQENLPLPVPFPCR